MGAAEVKQNPSLQSSFKFLQKKQSSAFGELTVMQDLKTKQLVALREQAFQSVKDFEEENAKLTKQAHQRHPNLISLSPVSSYCEKQFCSSVYKLVHAIEYLPLDLQSDLQQRKAPYTEQDLMALLKDVTSAMQFLHSRKLSHGDLRMNTIFLLVTNQKQIVFKIAETSVLRVMPGYLSALTGNETKGLYLSPKLMEGVRTKNWNPKHNASKSDVFSLACILLECALYQSSDELFDFAEGRIKRKVLEERKAAIQASFSEDFQQILFTMLALEESKRPDFQSLYEFFEREQAINSNESQIQQNVLKPCNRELQEIVNVNVNCNEEPFLNKENLTEHSKKGLDSCRLVEPIDKENCNQPPHQQPKQKVLKPLITVIENPEEKPEKTSLSPPYIPAKEPFILLMESDILEENMLPMQPDDQTNFPTHLPDANPQMRTIMEWVSDKPERTQATVLANSVVCQEKAVETPKEKQDNSSLDSNVFQYESGLSFIRPEIQAILDQFKREKPVEKLEPITINEQPSEIFPEKETKEKTCWDLNAMAIEAVSQNENECSQLNQNLNTMSNAPIETLMSLEEKILVYETYEDGSVYHGEKLNNMRDGKGKFYYSDGGMYDGQWKEGHIHGEGVLFYPNGCVAYEGQWQMDKFHGKGTVFNETPMPMTEFDYRNFEDLGEGWVKYQGDFVEDNKHGQGVLNIINGEKFVGNFFNDYVQGFGRYFSNDGNVTEGQWINNVLQE